MRFMLIESLFDGIHLYPLVTLLMSWWIICESKISINLDAMVKDLGVHAY